MQYVYRLDPLDLANGVIGRRRTLARLSARDLFSIGRERITKQKRLPIEPSTKGKPEYAMAIQWMEAAMT